MSNWVRALDTILALDVDAIVPGHGPLATKRDVETMRGYFTTLEAEARERHAAGVPALKAARDITLDAYAHWGESERIAVNVATIYRELDGIAEVPLPVESMGLMAEFAG